MNPQTLAWIERQKPQLVGWAEKFVQDTKLYEEKPRKNGHGPAAERDHDGDEEERKKKHPQVSRSQLRNLLSAAQSGSAIAVLVNFLRYQMGRESRPWKHRESGEGLERLLLDELQGLVDKAIPSRQTEERYELEAHLAAQLLGFIIREYTYRCSLEGTTP